MSRRLRTYSVVHIADRIIWVLDIRKRKQELHRNLCGPYQGRQHQSVRLLMDANKGKWRQRHRGAILSIYQQHDSDRRVLADYTAIVVERQIHLDKERHPVDK